MTQRERELFAIALHDTRLDRFKGNAKAAYTAAGVNSATWARAERGESIKPHTVAKICANLFPRTNGDFRQLLTADGDGVRLNYWDRNGLRPDDAGPLERALGLAAPESPSDLAAVGTALRDLQQQIGRLEIRVEVLEATARGEELALPSFERAERGSRLSAFVHVDSLADAVSEVGGAVVTGPTPPGVDLVLDRGDDGLVLVEVKAGDVNIADVHARFRQATALVEAGRRVTALLVTLSEKSDERAALDELKTTWTPPDELRLAPAARDRGRKGSSQQAREAQDQAGERPDPPGPDTGA